MIRALRLSGALLAVLSTPALHAAPLGDNTVRLAPSQLKLPQNIGPLRYGGESRFSDRRLGRSFGYNASGISLSIYVYDYGVADIPDGADSAPLCEQFESAKREIENGGNYENVRLVTQVGRPLADAPGAPVAREALYEFDRRGVRAVSALWLTAVDGYFVKLRLSLRHEVADELDEARTHILAAMADAIRDRTPRERRPEPPPGQDASIEVDSHYDADTAALWLAYAVELVSFSREHPDSRPPCGGRYTPGFEAELAARRAALASYRALEPERRKPGYFNDLARIDEAGYLDEYVWQFLRDERVDVTPSRELQIAAFEEFRVRELPAHVVQSGARVRINAVRRLPPP
jgi:hypothetical protein